MSFKNKSSYKHHLNKRRRFNELEPGLSGFLCTCNNKLKEKNCIWEAYSILNEYADKLFGPENPEKSGDEEISDSDKLSNLKNCENNKQNDSIEDELQKEIESIKSKFNKKIEERRFQAIQSGANGIVFIRSTVKDPVKLAHHIKFKKHSKTTIFTKT
ncbi:thump domain containing protein, putative [Pediculus humanus corporis]|uniref:Thump domain containing protein, putative n=1 Tax=Pediculus humanus subsp. corporis TaxID=121224 RepID=E0VMT7_PEDHC|nr:thump domain containing protein, putative [Pediculus humanus corporis]EEB14693.1 thump domain containing protein, putative [Pediculus humanus corporis]